MKTTMAAKFAGMAFSNVICVGKGKNGVLGHTRTMYRYLICWFVCRQQQLNNFSTNFDELLGDVRRVTDYRLDFVDDMDHDPDTGIF